MAESLTFGGTPRKLELPASGGKPTTITVVVGDLGCSVYGTVPRGTEDFVSSSQYLAMCRHMLALTPHLNNGSLTHYTAFSTIRRLVADLGLPGVRNSDLPDKKCAILEAFERRGVLADAAVAAAELPLSLDITNPSAFVDPAIIVSLPAQLQGQVATAFTPLSLPTVTMPQTLPLINPALGMENDDFNLSRYFYASGFIDQASRIGGTVNDEYVKAFTRALPLFGDDGAIPDECDVLTCLCSRHEDLSILTPLAVNRTAVTDMIELSHDNQPLAYVRTVYVEDYVEAHLDSLRKRETATPLVLKLTAVNSVTPQALKALVDAKATDSIFNQADKRWVIGLDPMFAECWPGAMTMLSMLFDHKCEYWSNRCRFITRTALLGMSDEEARPRVQMMRTHYSLNNPLLWYSMRGVYSSEGRSKIHYASGDRMRLGLQVGAYRDRQVPMLQDLSVVSGMDVANTKDLLARKDQELVDKDAELATLKLTIDERDDQILALTARIDRVLIDDQIKIDDLTTELSKVESAFNVKLSEASDQLKALAAAKSDDLVSFECCLAVPHLMAKPNPGQNPAPNPMLDNHWPAMCDRYVSEMHKVDDIWEKKLDEATDRIATEMAEETAAILSQREVHVCPPPPPPSPASTASSSQRDVSDDEAERESTSSATSSQSKKIIWNRSAARTPNREVNFAQITSARRVEHYELGLPREGRFPIQEGVSLDARSTMSRGLMIHDVTEFPPLIDFGIGADWPVDADNVLRS
nr:muNS protein [Piscine orthoreovirus]